MPAYFDSGVFAEVPAWHQEGLVLDQPHFSEADLVRLAIEGNQHAKNVMSSFSLSDCQATTPTGETVTVPETFAVIRDSDNKCITTTGTQGAQGICDVPRLIQTLTAILGEGNVKLDSAITLRGGQLLSVQAQLGEIRVKGTDLVKAYMWATTGLGGILATTVGQVQTRVVCSNTHAMAMKEGNFDAKIRHTASHEQRLQNAEEILAEYYALRQSSEELFNAMAETQVSDSDAERYFRKLLKQPTDGELSTRTQGNLDTLQGLYAEGDDLAADFQGTVWGLYNAGTAYGNHALVVRGEYSDKEKTQKTPEGASRRAASTMFGAGAKVNDMALALAKKCVTDGFDFLRA